MASFRGEAACTDRSVGWGWLQLGLPHGVKPCLGAASAPKVAIPEVDAAWRGQSLV